MNSVALNKVGDTSINKSDLSASGHSIEFAVLILLLTLSNVNLLSGQVNHSLAYFPTAVQAGEWWRLITYPFIHVSWYHLLLDGSAFLLLYRELKAIRLMKKVFYIGLSSATSLLITQLFSPIIYSNGLCGLSGIAHGLMAISGIEMMRKKEDYHVGLACVTLVVGKSAYELYAGNVIFSFMHMGLCGIPAAASHGGGVLGGVLAYIIGSNTKLKSS
jgi:rhomboid family GlyGly-CTERM serine protease